jgi:hypothetical protein
MAFRLEGSFSGECLKHARDSEGLSVLSPMDSLRGSGSAGINPDAIGARDLETILSDVKPRTKFAALRCFI